MVTSSTIPGYVPAIPENQSAAYKIFHHLFHCRVAYIHLQSKEYMEQSGIVTSGNPATDRQSALALTDCHLTIAAMAEFHSEGISIELVVPTDSLKIYQVIYDHMTDWSNATIHNVNITTAPVDDLKKLDELAAEVYKIARYHWKDSPYHGRLDHFLKNQSRNRGRRFVQQTTKLEHQPEHTPMADSINQQLKSRTRPWR